MVRRFLGLISVEIQLLNSIQQQQQKKSLPTDLGVEISVVNVFVVEVGHPPRNVTSQIHLLSPAQGDVILGQQLLQTAPTHILTEEGANK